VFGLEFRTITLSPIILVATLGCSKIRPVLTPPEPKTVFDFGGLYLRAEVELGARTGTVGKPYISTFQQTQYERKRTLEQKVIVDQRDTGMPDWGGGEHRSKFATM
jgi:hypothetical protein